MRASCLDLMWVQFSLWLAEHFSWLGFSHNSKNGRCGGVGVAFKYSKSRLKANSSCLKLVAPGE